MKKVVIFGGGTGLSQILKGLKLFPLDITAVVTVSDNGKSTGKLREELNIPAVGDITKVLLSMAKNNKDTEDLLNYRFENNTSLAEHSIKNLILAALLNIKGDFKNALPIFCDLFNIEGKVLPLTEENVDLVGKTSKGDFIVGESQITSSKDDIIDLYYDKKFKINKDVEEAILNADCIVFSAGSLLTSVLPHIINKEVASIISKSKSDKVYICNIMTQHGETDNFKVSDHIKVLNKYLGKNIINTVIANNCRLSKDIIKKYKTTEQKDLVMIDKKEIEKINVKLIEGKTAVVEDGVIRHDNIYTSYLLFSYLMEVNK